MRAIVCVQWWGEGYTGVPERAASGGDLKAVKPVREIPPTYVLQKCTVSSYTIKQ